MARIQSSAGGVSSVVSWGVSAHEGGLSPQALSTAQLQQMVPPPGVSPLHWELSDPEERREQLRRLQQQTSNQPQAVARASAQSAPSGGGATAAQPQGQGLRALPPATHEWMQKVLRDSATPLRPQPQPQARTQAPTSTPTSVPTPAPGPRSAPTGAAPQAPATPHSPAAPSALAQRIDQFIQQQRQQGRAPQVRTMGAPASVATPAAGASSAPTPPSTRAAPASTVPTTAAPTTATPTTRAASGAPVAPTTAPGSPTGTPAERTLQQLTQQFQARFAQLAQDPKAFAALLQKAFGTQYDTTKAEQLRQKALAGDFSWLPKIRVASQAQLKDLSGAQNTDDVPLGAYSKSEDTVYLSAELLASDVGQAEKTLSEEIGHALDVRLNKRDAAGDEGEIFGRLLCGEVLSAQQLAALQAENDHGLINIDGKTQEVEYGWGNPLKKLKKAVKKVAKAVKKAAKKVLDAPKKALKAVYEAHKKLEQKSRKVALKVMASKVFNAVLMVAQFIPVLQFAAMVIRMGMAAYMLYQGIKNKSVSMVLGGVAGLAGGASSVAGAMGATTVASYAATIQTAATAGSLAYQVKSQKSWSAGLELASMASKAFGNSSVGDTLGAMAKGGQAYDAYRSKDYAGAVSAGASALDAASSLGSNRSNAQSAGTGPTQGTQGAGSGGDKPPTFLGQTSRYAGIASSAYKTSEAWRKGDYAGAAQASESGATLAIGQDRQNAALAKNMSDLGITGQSPSAAPSRAQAQGADAAGGSNGGDDKATGPNTPASTPAPAPRSTTAKAGDSISSLIGTSDPEAVGQFMRENGLKDSTVKAGDTYTLPDRSQAQGADAKVGQATLNQDNRRVEAQQAKQTQQTQQQVQTSQQQTQAQAIDASAEHAQDEDRDDAQDKTDRRVAASRSAPSQCTPDNPEGLSEEQLKAQALLNPTPKNQPSAEERLGLGGESGRSQGLSAYDKFSTTGHIALGAAGMAPGVGVLPDAVDLVWTAAEMPFGKSSATDLGLSVAALGATVLPGTGDVAAGTAKIAARSGGVVGDVAAAGRGTAIPSNPTAYSVAFETKLNPADFGRSRDVHFNRANAALDNALKADADFAKLMDDLIPNVQSSVSPVGGRAVPTGWTWEHASSTTASGQQGAMRLVPSSQHTPGSPFWRVLHPDHGAAGGYSEWAIPNGAPKN